MKRSHNGKTFGRTRIKAIALHQEGYSNLEISRRLDVNRKSVALWIKIFNEQGIRALLKWKTKDKICRLSSLQIATLLRVLKNSATEKGYATSKWTSRRITEYVEKEFKVRYSKDHILKLLKKYGYNIPKGDCNLQLLSLLHILKTKKPNDYGFDSDIWSATLINDVCFSLFEVRFTPLRIYQFMNKHGWHFKDSKKGTQKPP